MFFLNISLQKLLTPKKVIFLQGGTIKLMVKTLGIDLEEDKGDVIGLDVQDKVNVANIHQTS